MALIKCKECGTDVSNKASSCPSCGVTIKKEPTKYGCGSVIFIAIVAMFVINMISPDKPKETAKSSVESSISPRETKLKKHFSGWDGSHLGLTKVIKKSMNDPNSYDHDNTVYVDKGSYLVIKTTFRGKNAFGGIVKSTVTAKVDLNGNVLEILSPQTN